MRDRTRAKTAITGFALLLAGLAGGCAPYKPLEGNFAGTTLSATSGAADRFTDNRDGTVTDRASGLVWLQDAGCFKRPMRWSKAMTRAASLAHGACGLEDGSQPEAWRLPTKTEWEGMIAQAVGFACLDEAGEGPVVTNDAGTGCYLEGSSFTGVRTGKAFWASTGSKRDPCRRDTVCLGGRCMNSGAGVESHFDVSRGRHYLWPVRAARIEELKRRGWIEDQTDAPVALPELVVKRDLAQRYLREDRASG